ncbi:hypothetical protein Bca4012_025957 [Brassica carinata]
MCRPCFMLAFLNSILEFNKLILLKTKAQEMLKNNEITKPVATMDLPGLGHHFDWFPSHIYHQIDLCSPQVK